MDMRAMLLTMVAFSACGVAGAQERSAIPRGSEFSIVLPYLDANNTDFDGGTVVSTESQLGLGFNFDYAFGERWAAGASLSFHEVDYTANIALGGLGIGQPGDVVDGELESTSVVGHVKRYFGDWPRVAPYAKVGLGVVSVDTNIPEGPPLGYCWWHPWWGYVCERVQPTQTSTDMTMSVGFGARWQVGRRVFLDASVAQQWIDFDNASRPGFTQFRLAVGLLR